MNEAFLLDNLIQQISGGDKEALGQLYDITSKAVYGYAFSILCHKSRSEDIMQDTFIQIFTQAKSYKSQGKAMAWILRITRNNAYNALKKQKRETAISPEFGDYMQDSLDENALIDRLVFNEVFTRLSDGERQIVMLYLLSGISQKNIAKITGIPLPTVKWRYKSALKKLSKIILDSEVQ